MTVTWTSGYSIKEALPFVEWGPKGGHQMLSPAGTLTFGRNSMCGRSVNLTFHFANDCLNAVMNYEYSMFAFRCVTTCYCRFTSTDCWVAWSWLYSYKFLEGIVAWCFCMWPASTLSISIPLLVLFPYILCHKEGQSYFNSWSCCRYTYKLGHRLSDGTHIWSKSYSFRASPYPGQDSLQRVVIFRDMGKVWFFAHLGKILCVVFISVSFSI